MSFIEGGRILNYLLIYYRYRTQFVELISNFIFSLSNRTSTSARFVSIRRICIFILRLPAVLLNTANKTIRFLYGADTMSIGNMRAKTSLSLNPLSTISNLIHLPVC